MENVHHTTVFFDGIAKENNLYIRHQQDEVAVSKDEQVAVIVGFAEPLVACGLKRGKSGD